MDLKKSNTSTILPIHLRLSGFISGQMHIKMIKRLLVISHWKMGIHRFYFSDKEDKGYINRLDFKVNNLTAATEDHPQHIDIVKLILPSPFHPGKK